MIIFRGTKIANEPPEVPESGADSFYSYENLPRKHWKKYIYGSRFVQMVRAKTPKITYHSAHAKCQLMETLADFEACFYDGIKIIQSGKGETKVFDVNGRSTSLSQLSEIHQTHYQQCLKHCQTLERMLTELHTDEECFPAIIGRRPPSAPVLNSVKDFSSTSNTPRQPNVSANKMIESI